MTSLIRKLIRNKECTLPFSAYYKQLIAGCSWQTCRVPFGPFVTSILVRKKNRTFLLPQFSLAQFFWQLNYMCILRTVVTKTCHSDFFSCKRLEAIEIFSKHNLDNFHSKKGEHTFVERLKGKTLWINCFQKYWIKTAPLQFTFCHTKDFFCCEINSLEIH